jgi:hypothetical protein
MLEILINIEKIKLFFILPVMLLLINFFNTKTSIIIIHKYTMYLKKTSKLIYLGFTC